MANRFGSEHSPSSPSVPAAAASFAQRQQGAPSSGPGVDGLPGEVEGDARLGEERAPIVLSGEEQARVNAAMARDSAKFLDRVLHGASGTGGADVQLTIKSLQQAVDMMQRYVDSILPQLKEFAGQFEAFSTEFESTLLDLVKVVRQS